MAAAHLIDLKVEDHTYKTDEDLCALVHFEKPLICNQLKQLHIILCMLKVQF